MTNPDNVGGLLPCPFCGAEPKLVKCVGYDQGQSSISCANCDVYMMDIHSHVIETWNRRELCRAAPAGGEPVARLIRPAPLVAGTIQKFPTKSGATTVIPLEECLSLPPGEYLLYTRPDAPAGGDVERDAHHERLYALNSAPAGSGEVEGFIRDLEKADSLLAKSKKLSPEILLGRVFIKHRAALLRKLQQGADYVMVPRTMTHAMLDAAMLGHDDVEETWEAILNASQGQQGAE